MSEFRADWWLTEGNLVQPKRQIGDYVESQGFLVPRRFDSVEEAIAQANKGGMVLARSEHPDEYANASGLFETYFISSARNPSHDDGSKVLKDPTVSEDQKIDFLRALNYQRGHVKDYAKLTGQNLIELVDGLSFSYWEDIDGTNLTIVADNAIDGRYHVLAYGPRSQYSGIVADAGGQSINSTINSINLPPDLLKKAIDQYEAIRNLPLFNPLNCPMMEMQLDRDDNVWFLQYHQARSFQAAMDELDAKDFDKAEGWRQVEFVRGAIEPTTLNMSLWYPEKPQRYGFPGSLAYPLPKKEDAAMFEPHLHMSALGEVLARRRQAYVYPGGYSWYYENMAGHHTGRSQWFKPRVGVALPESWGRQFIPEDIAERTMVAMMRDQKMARVVIDLASDGRVGYVRLNPDSEQPVCTDF